MLRFVHTARFAYKHSPEKEQRLLAFANDPNEGLESSEFLRHSGSSPDTPIEETIAAETHREIFETAPDVLLLDGIPEKASLFDTVRRNGALDAPIEAYALANGINLDALDGPQKEAIITDVLKDTKNALSVTKMLEERKASYEEYLRVLGERLAKLQSSSTKLQIHDVKQLLSVIDEIKTRPDADEDTNVDRIGDAFGISASENKDALNAVLFAVEDIVRLQAKRNAFAEYKIGDKPEDTERTLAKDRELNLLDTQSELIREYLDIALRRDAETGYAKYAAWARMLTEKTDEQILQETGVSPFGLRYAYDKSTLVFLNIARKNDLNPSTDNLPKPGKTNYLEKVEESLEGLTRAKKALEIKTVQTQNGTVRIPAFALEQLREEEANEDMARNVADRTNALLRTLDSSDENTEDTRKKLQNIQSLTSPISSGNVPSALERLQVRNLKISTLEQYRNVLDIAEKNTELIAKVGAVEKKQRIFLGKNTPEGHTRLREKLENIEQELPGLLTHSVCRTTNAGEFLRIRLRELRIDLTNPKGMTNEAFSAASFELGELGLCVKYLKEFTGSDKVIRVKTQEEFATYKLSPNVRGFYDYRAKNIVINEAACGDKAGIQATIAHEKGHAVLDILCRRTMVAPNLLSELHFRLKSAHLEGDLLKAAQVWNCTGDSEDRIDELIVQYSDYEAGRIPNPTEEELRLFRQFQDQEYAEDVSSLKADLGVSRAIALSTTRDPDAAPEPEKAEKVDLSKTLDPDPVVPPEKEPKSRKVNFSDILGPETIIPAEPSATPPTPPKNPNEDEGGTTDIIDRPDPRQKLQAIDANVRRIESFLEVYPEHRNDPNVSEYIEDIKKGYEKGKKAFESGKDESNVEISEQGICDILQEPEELSKALIKEIKRIDLIKMDVSDATMSQKSSLRKRLFDGVAWMSVYDWIGLTKSSMEDIQRMWKRRGESVQATAGKAIFKFIPEKIPYVGQLYREFAGREKASEQEEVGVWEKRYEKIDSHVLLHDILPHLINKDQVKGVVNLLTKRGRMDWNYEPFWDVLETLSVYGIPHEGCRRDPQLRNQYLQKLIANIWDDKDQYEHWKNENDSQIESGKSHLKATIDELSATEKGLANKLEYLLEKQKLLQQHIELPKEEEVNPHLYEGILHYAMRNGKMTMEDKIFYLIQGVASGMISIDRIKGFVGEQGDILNSFPVIDFFNGKTYPEIMAMAIGLGHPNLNKPDVRTSDFLLDVIRLDDTARKRTQKGLKAVQNWDHEDLPMFLTMLDHKAMNDIVAPTSGSTPKVTMEGLKNMFIGFNTALQYFAIRAKSHLKRGTPFTDEDAKQCAIIIAAYANFNNRVTIPAAASTRPTLSWTNIDSEKPVSDSSGKYTKDYRNAVGNFIVDLTRGPNGIGLPEKIEIVKEGAVKGKTIKDYLGIERNGTNTPTDTYSGFGDLSNIFNDKMIKAAVANKANLINKLAAMADRTIDDGGFIPENDDYTYENMKDLIKH